MPNTEHPNNMNANTSYDSSNNGQHSGARVRSYGIKGGAANTAASAPVSGHMSDVSHQQSQPLQEVQAQISQPEVSHPKRKKSFWVAIAVAIICVILAALLAFTMCDAQKGSRQGDLGQLDGKSQEEIQAELDRVVDEGMFNISIASVVEFENGTSEGELRIENVPSNHYLMKVSITRDDTKEEIYKTDFIEPNHHIQADTLDVALPKGEYPSTAVFSAYDEETEELIGQAAAKVTIKVLG